MMVYLWKTDPAAFWSKIVQSGWSLDQHFLFIFSCQILLKKRKLFFFFPDTVLLRKLVKVALDKIY